MASTDIIYMVDNDSRRVSPDDSDSNYQLYYPNEIPVFLENSVTPLLDGNNYFKDLYNELQQLELNRQSGISNASDQRIYILGWVFSSKCSLTDGSHNYDLKKLLEDAADDGVDVRIVLWVSDSLVKLDSAVEDLGFDVGFANVCIENIKTCKALRGNLNLENKVLLNVLSHQYGSCHSKTVILVDRFDDDQKVLVYTGGIDFSNGRKSDQLHITNHWHDLQVKLEGAATAPVFDSFKEMWNELVQDRIDLENQKVQVNHGTSFLPQWEEIVAGFENTTKVRINDEVHYAVPKLSELIEDSDILVPSIPNSPSNAVQFLKTLPNTFQALWKSANKTFPATVLRRLSISENGTFEIQLAFKVAISKATNYIYIENSVIYSRDILGYLKAAIMANPSLKVIILTATSANSKKLTRPLTVHNYYIHEFLYKDLDEDQKKQIVLYKSTSYYVHSKVMIIDDKFALVGSANIANRSLYSDFEHAIGFIDNEGYESVKQLRIDLWAEHFRISQNEKLEISDINIALHVWNELWGNAGASFKLPSFALNSYNELTAENHSYEELDFKASLIPLKVFTKDTDGNDLQRPTAIGQANSGGEFFLEDLDLANGTVPNLEGGWILITEGPNIGQFYFISMHSQNRLDLDTTTAIQFDETNKYLLLFPALFKEEINEPAENFSLTYKQELEEIGTLP